jgi:hypothetical protein
MVIIQSQGILKVWDLTEEMVVMVEKVDSLAIPEMQALFS